MFSHHFKTIPFSRGDSESSNSAGRGAGGGGIEEGVMLGGVGSRAASLGPATPDVEEQPLLTERDHRELLSLLNQVSYYPPFPIKTFG